MLAKEENVILSLIGPEPNPVVPKLESLGRVVYLKDLAGEEANVTTAVAAYNQKFPKALLDRLPNLKMIADFGVGFDGFALDEIIRRGIRFAYTPGLLSEDVADYGLALLFALARRIPEADRFVRDGRWEAGEAFPMGTRFFGKKIGVAGLGRIGRIIAKRAEAFEMEVGYTAHSKKDVPYRWFESLKDLAAWSDFLILVIPGSAENTHLVNAEVLEALGPKGFLINIARGSVVDTEALIGAIETGKIAGAALDVFEHEPKVEEALRRSGKVILAPHIGSATTETREAMAELVAENMRRFMAGEPVATPVPGTQP